MEKIVLISPSLRNGGSERVISELANFWAENGKAQVFLLLLTDQKQFYQIHPNVTVIVPKKHYKNSFSKFLFKGWVSFFIRNSLYKICPDTVLSFGEKYNNIVLLSLIGTNFKVFVSDRNSPNWNIGRVHRTLRKLLYKNATGIIAQTESFKNFILTETRNRNILVMPNPFKRRDLKEIDSSGRKNIILNVGRLVEQKNQLELIEIFSKCQNEGWLLYIIGEGHLEFALKNKVKDLGLEDKVFVIPPTKNINFYYDQAKILAFTSLYEGFPNVLGEAMISSLPCIAYDCETGPRELIEHEFNGFLVEFQNQKKYIETLNRLLFDENLRTYLGRNASKLIDKVSIEKVSDQCFDFILK